jgi:hypothetical protein
MKAHINERGFLQLFQNSEKIKIMFRVLENKKEEEIRF